MINSSRSGTLEQISRPQIRRDTLYFKENSEHHTQLMRACALRALSGTPTTDTLRRRSLIPISRALVTKYSLDFEVLLETEHPVFAAVARLLIAPERNAAVHRRTVQVYPAGANSRRDAARAVDIAGLHVARQAVGGVVGDGDSLVLGIVGHHRKDRTENLFLGNGHVRRY